MNENKNMPENEVTENEVTENEVTENEVTEIIIKKTRGRPKKIKQEDDTEIKTNIKIGRPKKYFTEEEYKQAKRQNSKNDYGRRGYIYIKLVTLKKTYNLEYPSKEDMDGKTKEELLEMLKNISSDVEEIKKQKHLIQIEKIQNKLFEAINKKDFRPKSKYGII